MPTGFWVEGYWGVRSPEPIETIQIKRSAESIKNIQIERSAEPIKTIQIKRSAESIKDIQIKRCVEPIKTQDASTQAPPLALVPCTCVQSILHLEHTTQRVHISSGYSQVLRGSTLGLEP